MYSHSAAARPVLWCLLAATTLAAAPGCGRAEPASACSRGEIHFAYTGNANGRGALAVDSGADGSLATSVTFVLPQELQPKNEAKARSRRTAVIRAAGRCAAERMHLVLSGTSDKIKDRYTILGGAFEGVLAPELTAGSYGVWELEVHDEQLKRTDKLAGFWRELPQGGSKRQAGGPLATASADAHAPAKPQAVDASP